jgi:HD-GYP domain-containing protein (c-di-GMP phosphodiesterase class II)
MDQVIIRIAAAANMRALYPANHPRVVGTVEQIVTALRHALDEKGRDSLTLLIVGDDLVVDQEVVRKTTLSQRQFIQAMKRRGIERLTLAAGLTAEETNALIEGLAGVSAIPPPSPHIIFGQVHVGADDPRTRTEEQRELAGDQLDVVREAFARFRNTRTLPFGAMEQLVWSFIDSLSRSTRAILPLAKLKEHDEYTFIHSVNVSLLVLAQAKSFGMEGTMLHAFGMAGLLHDVGKLMVPLHVLNKPGKLEADEWQTMQSHAEEGAWYLSEIEGTLPLAINTAYEHHLRFDGQPSYPLLRTPRIPNLASGMTSIADAFDAMMTMRPYQKPLLRSAAQQILSRRAGTFYDPLLVGTFIQIVSDNT